MGIWERGEASFTSGTLAGMKFSSVWNWFGHSSLSTKHQCGRVSLNSTYNIDEISRCACTQINSNISSDEDCAHLRHRRFRRDANNHYCKWLALQLSVVQVPMTVLSNANATRKSRMAFASITRKIRGKNVLWRIDLKHRTTWCESLIGQASATKMPYDLAGLLCRGQTRCNATLWTYLLPHQCPGTNLHHGTIIIVRCACVASWNRSLKWPGLMHYLLRKVKTRWN